MKTIKGIFLSLTGITVAVIISTLYIACSPLSPPSDEMVINDIKKLFENKDCEISSVKIVGRSVEGSNATIQVQDSLVIQKMIESDREVQMIYKKFDTGWRLVEHKERIITNRNVQ